MTSTARLRFLVEHEATVVFATPTYALHLAELAAKENIDLAGSSVRAVVVAGEHGGTIPATRSRKAPIPYDRDAYRTRNLVERLWCRLKDWRRIATRYDKLAANYLAGVFLAASISFWCAN